MPRRTQHPVAVRSMLHLQLVCPMQSLHSMHPSAGDEVCGEIVSRGGPAPTEWSRLLEPLPFFELFKHYLQVGCWFFSMNEHE